MPEDLNIAHLLPVQQAETPLNHPALEQHACSLCLYRLPASQVEHLGYGIWRCTDRAECAKRQRSHEQARAKDALFDHLDTCGTCCTIGTMSCQEGLRLRAYYNDLDTDSGALIASGGTPSSVLSAVLSLPKGLSKSAGPASRGRSRLYGGCSGRCQRSASSAASCRCRCAGSKHGSGRTA